MSANEIFEGGVRSAGDLAGVFEYDSANGYFYLYETNGGQGQRIVGSIRLLTTSPDFGQCDVEIRWDRSERNVGFFVRGQLWAVFDGITKEKFGGDYRSDGRAKIPTELVKAFEAE